jgi:hypothetical protein
MRILDHSDSPPPPPRRPLVPYLAALLLLGGLALLGGFWLGPGDSREPATAPATTPARTPAAESPARAGGSIEVTASQTGASVVVDGREMGTAPLQVDGLDGGAHLVAVTKPGYLRFERRVHVIPGRSSKLAARLEPEPKRFRIESDVPEASVFIDREFVGITPLVISGLAAGTHRLNVSKEGYEMYAETLEIGASPEDIMVRFKELRLDLRIEVVHRHTFGSCQGVLQASLDGLRYEPESGDHGFVVALDQLERFEVDYLKKNLRIKPRGGKTYNFTDRTANADALFSFHRDVERARQASE